MRFGSGSNARRKRSTGARAQGSEKTALLASEKDPKLETWSPRGCSVKPEQFEGIKTKGEKKNVRIKTSQKKKKEEGVLRRKLVRRGKKEK